MIRGQHCGTFSASYSLEGHSWQPPAASARLLRRKGVDDWGEYWHFTSQSMHELFQETFPGANIQIETYGNVLAAITYLHGLVTEDLRQEELNYLDRDYEVLITVRAVKPDATR